MAVANSVGRKSPVSGVGNLKKSREGGDAERREKKNLDFTDCDDNTSLAICSQIFLKDSTNGVRNSPKANTLTI
jgi:hypothetical protein